jgi:peptidoglycan/xylan/chitin deacetylase (PgdA/CDA1 family)
MHPGKHYLTRITPPSLHLPGLPHLGGDKPADGEFDPNTFAEISIRSQDQRIPVIMYHDVIKKRDRHSVWFDCTVDELKEQFEFFKSQNATPISLHDLHAHLVAGKPVPPNPVVLTFDDNYQGFFDNAYPLLKEYNYPAAMFVHTNYVGDKTGDHPKMDWDELKKLDAEHLVTIGSHTMSHPDDMRTLTPEKQEQELTGSKSVLESHLGHPIPYLAYPDGHNDEVTRDATRRAGYTMAFSVDNGMAEESPGILNVNRYIHTRYQKAWDDRNDAIAGAPAAVVDIPLKAAPVTLEIKEYAGVKLGLVRGGTPTTRRAAERQSVGFFVRDVQGVAGINGTFFADARLAGISNILIGPSQTGQETEMVPESDAYRLTVIRDRPLVFWGPSRFAICPFQPGFMNSADAMKAFMPDYTDAFVAGAWIVHNGAARSDDDMKHYSAGDFADPRKRAFYGITADGQVVLGATVDVVPTEKMAEAAAAAGVQEAVLLDSGFSTSLVYDNKIIVTGHTAEDIPSRPVPHAIVLTGTLAPVTDPDVQAFLTSAGSSLVPAKDESFYVHRTTHRKRRRTRRRRHSAPASPDGAAAPATQTGTAAPAPP